MAYIHGAGGGGGGGGGGQPKVKQPPKPRIAQDDPALKSVSFAKLQFLLCEGEVEGPAFGSDRNGLERSVFLDGTPVRTADGTVNPQPEDLVFSWGRDHSVQSGVPGYTRVTEVVGVDQTCNFNVPIAQTVTGDVVGGKYYASVLLTWEALMVTTVDGDQTSGNNGDVRTYDCAYSVVYVDAGGTTRTPFDSSINGKFSSTFQRSHEFELQGTGPWVIRVTRKTVNDDTLDPNVEVARSTFNFSSIGVSLDQKFSYANSSVLSVGVKADNYAAIPNVSVELRGNKIQVPSNFDPITRTHTGTWDGTFKVAWTDNPAWIFRDLVLNDRYGAGQYIDESFVDKWSLYDISKYCCESVPAPGGGNEPRFTCNLLLQSSGEAWEVLQQISSIFRGMVYYASSIAVAAQDRAKEAIFTFNESNTIQQITDDGLTQSGNFTYSGSARRAVHTVALVSWDDPQNEYETRIEYMTDDETYVNFGYRPIDIRLLGVTSRGQALRAGTWTLLSERLLSDTVAFQTNEIGMALRPGDIVKIADPTKAAVRGGGRILGVVGNRITLDYVPETPPGGVVGSRLSWMYNEPTTPTEGPNQPRLQEANVISIGTNVVLTDWENGQGQCVGDTGTEIYDESDVCTDISGTCLSICTDPEDPIFDPGATPYDDADVEPRDQITQGRGDVVVIDGNGGHPPEVGNPFLLEYPNRTAQLFRILTITQEDDGVYAVTGLRYRDDIYNAVDFDTPLEEDQNYLFQAVVPDAPRTVVSQVIWDNNSAKIEVRWTPPANSQILFEYDLSVRYYRVQWQSGTVQADKTIQWSGSWSERPPQEDDRDFVPLEQLSISDKFRVRVAAVGRLGIQSDWSTIVVSDDITTWFPMPDISVGSDVLTFTNQSSGGQLFTWDFSGLSLPPYISGLQLDVKPDRPLTPRELAGLRPPLPGTDIYVYGDFPLEEYGVAIFHADTNWTCRIHFLTFVTGLEGSTYATVTVTRDDIVPPAPDLFTVVTDTDKESIAPMRRFSWSLPTSEIDDTNTRSTQPLLMAAVDTMIDLQTITPNWPLGKVTDIVQFLVRYKAGFNNTWDLGVSLFADGVPGDQRFFETELFDGGQWTVMIRSVDRTGWVSDDQAAIVINLGDAIPTNVVETFDAKADGWPGQKINCSVEGGNLVQTDPTKDAEYLYPFEVTAADAGILITTVATNDDPAKSTEGGTYQWFLRELGADLEDPMYPDPQTDPIYPDPQTDYMYLDTNRTIGNSFHPYVPFEKLPAGNYEIGCRIRSIDGAAKTLLTATELQLDYPDVTQTMEDIDVDNSGNDRVTFPKPFPHACKAVSCTLQDPDGSVTVPATAYLRGKDVNGFNIRLIDADGNIVEGLIDVTAVGY